MADRTPNEHEVTTLVTEILRRQLNDDPHATTISSEHVLTTLSDNGFSHDHELLVEGPAEDVWGRYLRGDISNPLTTHA